MAITLVTLQAAPYQLHTACMARRAGRVAIVFQRIDRPGTGLVMQAKRRVLKVIVTAYGAPAARYHAPVETLDNRGPKRWISRGTITLHRQPSKYCLVITEHQQMILRAVAKVVVNTLLLTQPLDEMQVGLPVLHAKCARWIHHRPQLKRVGVGKDTVVFEDRGNHLRYAALLKNPLVATMGKGCQAWGQRQVIKGEPRTGIIPTDGVDLPM